MHVAFFFAIYSQMLSKSETNDLYWYLQMHAAIPVSIVAPLRLK